MFVKPRDGLKILRPDTRTVLLTSGEHVPKTSFWLRRLKDGDVIESSIEVAKPKKEKSYTPKKKKIDVKEDEQTQLEVE